MESDKNDFNGEEETELSRLVKEREQLKDDTVARAYEEKYKALFEEENVRKDNSLTLKLIEECNTRDKDTMSVIKDNLPDGDPNVEKASEILDKLEALDTKVSDLKDKWHSNDLPPISQDSSDIHQTDFNS